MESPKVSQELGSLSFHWVRNGVEGFLWALKDELSLDQVRVRCSELGEYQGQRNRKSRELDE